MKRGHYVIGVDKETYAANTDLLNGSLFNFGFRFKYIKSDINDLEFLHECDFVINTAAETHVGNSLVNSDEFIHTNINGVHHLLELLKNKRQETSETPVFIHFSTDEVYGDIEKGSHKETDMLKPSNPYSASKAAADMLITAWGRTYKVPYIIVRPTNNYGFNQNIEKLIPKTIKYLYLGKKIPLHNNGTPVRNWLNSLDTVNAILTIMEKGSINEIYNISGSYQESNINVVKKIMTYYFDESDFSYQDYIDLSYSREGQDIRYSLNDSKLRKLGWKPKEDFDESLKDIVYGYKCYYKSGKFQW